MMIAGISAKGDNLNALKYNIRRYREGDDLGIVELIKQEFKTEFNPEFNPNIWKWKYKENPAHAFPIIWVAEDKDEIIGHYAINPVMMKWKDSEILGSQASGIATHRNYQRRGIFKTLASKVSDDARKKGIPITYVFPNPKSYQGFLKMGWNHIFSLIVMAKALNVAVASRKYRDNIIIRKIVETGLYAHTLLFKFKFFPIPTGITIFEINLFDDSFDILWANVSKHYDYIIKRDSKYLNWRYSHPSETFKVYTAKKDNNNIMGYAILKCKILPDVKIGYIYDLFCDPNDKNIIKCLISKSIEYFMKRKMDLVQICVLKSHPYYQICKEYGFLKVSEKPFVLHINSPEFDNMPEDFKDQKGSFLSYGDREGGF